MLGNKIKSKISGPKNNYVIVQYMIFHREEVPDVCRISRVAEFVECKKLGSLEWDD